jgi:hypothetical protein
MSRVRVVLYRCPFCGLSILADDSTRTIHHEATNPNGRSACPQWEAKMRSFGLTETRSESLIVYDAGEPLRERHYAEVEVLTKGMDDEPPK